LKLKYKAALIMTLLGVVIVILLSSGYGNLSHRIIIDREKNSLKSIAGEIALHVNSRLIEKARIASTLSSAPIIKAILLKSNSEFSRLPDQKRIQAIDKLNQRWVKTTEINDPFIQAYINNPLGEYFRHQRTIIPGEYGEIFLTNRFGLVIAATNKLTTLSHANKYWWLACDDDGRGRIFLDDRGFDVSVQGYVLGVVIPIMDENEVIGILKCNVNILGPLTDIVRQFGLHNPGMLKIVRTGGLVVSEHGKIPLSTRVSQSLVESLRQKVGGITTITENGENHFVANYPIPITMGSPKAGFGGSKESIDHLKGNKGEGWHIVISRREENVIETAHESTRVIIISGIVFTILTAFIALLLGNWVSRPIVVLAAAAKTIGEGYFDTRAKISSNDEIGSLTKSLNRMAEKLKDTMTSRDNLVYEVNKRKKADEEKEKYIIELKK